MVLLLLLFGSRALLLAISACVLPGLFGRPIRFIEERKYRKHANAAKKLRRA